MLCLVSLSFNVQVFEVPRVLLFSEGGNAKEVVLVEAVCFALLQASKDQIVLDFLRSFDDALYRQKFIAKLLIFHVLQTLDQALLLHICDLKVLL